MSTANYELSEDFKNDSVFLLVEKKVYSVNRRVLLHDSEFFQELFELPPEKGRPVEGSSAEHPLRIEGIAQGDFEIWLRAMFPLVIDGVNDVTSEQWMIVLKLLTMWRFTVSTRNVLERLQACADPITKILLAQRFELDKEAWLVPSVRSLAQRPEPLSEDEGAKLGGINTAKIARIREGYFCCNSQFHSDTDSRCKSPDWESAPSLKKGHCRDREEHSFTVHIRSMFGVL